MKILVAAGIATLAVTSAPALADPGAKRNAASPSTATPMDPADNAARGFPARLRSDLGRAHQIGSGLARGSAVLTTQVRVCIRPTGAVDDVKLMKGSGRRAFDAAVLDSAVRWAYSPYAAPRNARVCGAVSVVYRATPNIAARGRAPRR
jgi:TonB family protein